MFSFLPQNIQDAIKHLNAQDLYEIRLRANNPVRINYKGYYHFLSLYGLTDRADKALICDAMDIEDCVYRAGKYSVYSVEEQIKQGFITAENGVRIGLAGEYVRNNGKPLTIRNFTSLCVRIPHEIIGSGEEIYQRCMSDKVHNLLIASSPGQGKTTILRDLSRLLYEKRGKNVLICDERGEISVGNVGVTCDVLRSCDKATAFEAGIRAMRPDIIITDELSPRDCEAVEKAVFAGVSVLASAHFSSMEMVSQSYRKLFDTFVFLDEQNLGKIRFIKENPRTGGEND
jgi:stage III sporulation protein AA